MAVVIRVLLLTASLIFPAASAWLDAFEAHCPGAKARGSIECAILLDIR